VQAAKASMGVEEAAGAPRTQILNGVSAVFPPCMTGILGPSGCGKTSLLDIIAGRKTLGSVSGTVCVNGHSLDMEQRKQCIGYVTQEDVLQASATVWEVLAFHAAMRMPNSSTPQERALAVDATLETLRLSHRANTRIGSTDHKGVSGGEKRRVSIGIQLLAGCRAIVLDEPLSGLDSSSALLVLEALDRLVAERTHCVIMTVHQPSSRLLNKFSKILLLAPHGHLVYAGPRSSCIDHFESIGLPALPIGYSPAEYLLDVVTPSTGGPRELPSHRNAGELESGVASKNAAESSPRGPRLSQKSLEDREKTLKKRFDVSDLKTKSETRMKMLETSAGASSDVALPMVDEEERVGPCMQFFILLQRSCVNIFRVPALFFANIMVAFVVGLFIAGLFHNMATDLQGLISRSGLFFFALSFYMLSTITGLGTWQEARLLYLHERSSGAYHPTPYFLASTLSDILINRCVPVLIFACTMYWPANLRWHPVAMINFGAVLLLSSLCSSAIMACVALAFRRLPTAQLVGSMLCMCWMLLAGALLNAQTLGPLKWMLFLSPLSYAFDLLMINEFGRGAVFQINPRGLKVSVLFTGDQVLDQFVITEDDFAPQAMRLGAITVFALLLSYVLQRFFLKERR